MRSGGGNHRGSIFRLIVGTALIGRDGHKLPTWGEGSSAAKDIKAAEVELERAVSEVIRTMPFVWLAVDDERGPASMRGKIERNAIALLSNFNKPPLDPPSPRWLGHHCDRVRASGLLNQNHVDESYNPAVLDDLERLVGRVNAGHDVSHQSAHAPEVKQEPKQDQTIASQREIGPQQEQGRVWELVCSLEW